MSREREYTIRLANGESIYGEYGWMACDGPEDWLVAEESDHDEPTEYVIERWEKVGEWRRLFGGPLEDDGSVYSAEQLERIKRQAAECVRELFGDSEGGEP